MDPKIVVIVAILSIIIVVCSIYQIKSRKLEKPITISDSIFGLFESSNINNYSDIRQEMNIGKNTKIIYNPIDLNLIDQK